jgi:hypothetical protein
MTAAHADASFGLSVMSRRPIGLYTGNDRIIRQTYATWTRRPHAVPP